MMRVAKCLALGQVLCGCVSAVTASQYEEHVLCATELEMADFFAELDEDGEALVFKEISSARLRAARTAAFEAVRRSGGALGKSAGEIALDKKNALGGKLEQFPVRDQATASRFFGNMLSRARECAKRY